MARMPYDPPNFLVLDEPTNHLDLATKEMLVEALSQFEGTMIFVSHDRAFLRGLSTRVLELGGTTGTARRTCIPDRMESTSSGRPRGSGNSRIKGHGSSGVKRMQITLPNCIR